MTVPIVSDVCCIFTELSRPFPTLWSSDTLSEVNMDKEVYEVNELIEKIENNNKEELDNEIGRASCRERV